MVYIFVCYRWTNNFKDWLIQVKNIVNSWTICYDFEGSTRTLHSPIDSWSFHLESTWTHGVHLESRWNLFGREPSQNFVYFHLDSTWIPDGLHGLHVESMDSTPFHITLHSTLHLSMDSTWTPPGLQRGLYPPPVIPAGIRRNKIWQAVLPNMPFRGQ